jgi:Protein of unknown function (DUF1566)/Collagen triple helix repeat (20 copies)
MRIVLSRRFATVAAVFVVAIMASGRAIAQQAASQIPAADGQFYACVRIDRDGDEGRLARLVAANEACRRNETRVHWSATGPQGPQGQPGTNGTNGTNGTSGTNGTNGRDGTNGTNGRDGTNATRAAGPCFDTSNRYVDCGNGTVTDTVTGLIWLKDAGCFQAGTYWPYANSQAAGLANGQCNLTDGSSPGDWRLPTADEWGAMIARAVALGCAGGFGSFAPALLNDAGTGCFNAAGGSSFERVGAMFSNVASFAYWSSTANEAAPYNVWVVGLEYGGLSGSAAKYGGGPRTWPVRSGRR